MHQNENATRKRKQTRDGNDQMKIQRKKITNQNPTAYYVKEDATYGEQTTCWLLYQSPPPPKIDMQTKWKY